MKIFVYLIFFSFCILAQTRYTEQKLVAYDGVNSERFGTNVSISKDFLIVGAPFDNDLGYKSGSAYLYTKTDTGWVLVKKLLSPEGEAEFEFGHHVYMDDEQLIIGEIRRPGSIENIGNGGAVYVFRKDNNWNLSQKLYPSSISSGDRFGYSIDRDGDYLIISALLDRAFEGGPRCGTAHIYKKNGNVWTYIKKIVPTQQDEGMQYGIDVAIKGDWIFVGANVLNIARGAVYVYKKNGDNWSIYQKLIPQNVQIAENFGFRIAISETRALISSPAYDIDPQYNSNNGAVYVYEYEDTLWVEKKIILGPHEFAENNYGIDVLLENDSIGFVGAWKSHIGFTNSGAAYMLKKKDSI